MTITALILMFCLGLASSIIENRNTRKALIDMSIALDALTAQVATLETQAAAAVTEIARLQAAGENAPALDALTARIKAAGDVLSAAIAPTA